jgi:hypothetical protein
VVPLRGTSAAVWLMSRSRMDRQSPPRWHALTARAQPHSRPFFRPPKRGIRDALRGRKRPSSVTRSPANNKGKNPREPNTTKHKRRRLRHIEQPNVVDVKHGRASRIHFKNQLDVLRYRAAQAIGIQGHRCLRRAEVIDPGRCLRLRSQLRRVPVIRVRHVAAEKGSNAVRRRVGVRIARDRFAKPFETPARSKSPQANLSET